MTKFKTVEEYLSSLEPDKKQQVLELRRIIMAVEPGLVESIKWNAPNYRHRDYDRLTFSTLNKEGKVKLILHMGAEKKEDKKGTPVLAEPTGMIVWHSDIRGSIMFESLQDILSKKKALGQIIRRWLDLSV